MRRTLCHVALAVAWLGVAAALAACFGPGVPTGLACSESGRCPDGQSCVDGTCRDDDGPAADASAADAPSGGDGGAPGDAHPVDGGESGACAELRPLELPLVLGFSVISDPVVAGGPIKFAFESFGGEHIGIEIADREGAGGRVAEKVCTGGFTAHVA
jgi:hypothetical protein